MTYFKKNLAKVNIILYTVFSSYLTWVLMDMISLFFKASDPELKGASWNFSKIFFLVIFILFFIGIAQLMFRFKKLKSFAGSIPSHLTAIGILGTFFGIFIGLYKFDVNNLHLSVPLLLDGMKLAFSTSIAGLTSSTILKVAHSITVSIFQSDDPYAENENNPEVMNIINTINANNSKLNENLNTIIILLNELYEIAIMSMSEKEFENYKNLYKKRSEDFGNIFNEVMENLLNRKTNSKL